MLTSNYDILVVIDRIYSYELKSNYLEKHKFFAEFFFNFWNQHKIFNVLKKNESQGWSILQVIDSESADLNA